jgi:preprotein translocase subunit SecY
LFDQTHWLYSVLYFVLIVAFSYFYIAIQYNPTEMANNLQKNNGAIPGIRPGKPTADFISRIIGKITFIGAMFLGVIALLPTIIGAVSGIQGVTIGGTTVIIVVSVALETARSLESQMMMRHYKGFLE